MVGQESVMVLNKCYTICSRVDCRPCVLRLDLVSYCTYCIVSSGCRLRDIGVFVYSCVCFVLFRVLQVEIFGYRSSQFYTMMRRLIRARVLPGTTTIWKLDESKRLFRIDLL